ncbi:hypothetical protein BaRGS_00020053 [Batillaria attramentaria]|uniref:Polypeptide N-acetylgalactosaminyltransferase n=1 Tax=Batillaria attramentaria TaxID=370345 RepID=A0ABD0KNG3_9CAEN
MLLFRLLFWAVRGARSHHMIMMVAGTIKTFSLASPTRIWVESECYSVHQQKAALVLRPSHSTQGFKLLAFTTDGGRTKYRKELGVIPLCIGTFAGREGYVPVISLFTIVAALVLLIFDDSFKVYDIENGQFGESGLFRLLQRGAGTNVNMTPAETYPDDIFRTNDGFGDPTLENSHGRQEVHSRNSRKTAFADGAESHAAAENTREPPKRNRREIRVQVNVREENQRNTVHANGSVDGRFRGAIPSHVVRGWTPPQNAGESGRGVEVDEDLLSSDQKAQFKKGWEQHSFNEFVSNLISLHRSLPDPRDRECLTVQYRSELPDTGVVIIFHNEAWSTLLRTVHSVLDRSPSHLLRQIVLVDDFSTLDHLKKPLDDYLARLEKVKLVRTSEREGLIRARLIGLSHITTTVVVFLDSHCECAVGWLEPMLDRIAENSSTVVVPVIDAINDKTFEFNFQPARGTNVGTFTWNLSFSWMPIPDRERRRRKRDIDPIMTPTMAGGLFAIDRLFFYKLGTYDPGMRIWGGENLELSFRIWMCGGRLETVPCSHVGHVFRGHAPYTHGGVQNPISTNLGRLAAVWLDDYQVYYRHGRQSRGQLDIGDVSERVKLRKELNCHSFAWYLEHVMPDMFVPADVIAHGAIYNDFSNTCFARVDRERIGLRPCTRNTTEKGMQWSMNLGQWTVFQGKHCLDYASGDAWVTEQTCHGYGGNQLWKYSPEQKQLSHVISKRCAEMAPDGPRLIMTVCDVSNPRQQWLWDTRPVPGPSWRKDKAAGIRRYF